MLTKVDHRTLQAEAFRQDVIAGLSRPQKVLPSRWLYDDIGCELFEEITGLEEYYPTRTETAILRAQAPQMARFCGSGATLLEYGAGAGIKTTILLDALEAPRAYVPIDIAGDFLELTARRVRQQFPRLDVQPIVADFTAEFEIPNGIPKGRRVVFFPGSTIGNLDPRETALFLRQVRRHAGKGGGAIIGIDLRKSLDVLLPAYDDARGVTAAFDLNLLHRINRELGGDFRLEQFRHEARWNEADSAVEMHLVSLAVQTVKVDGRAFAFAAGETIHTESSRKYDVDRIAGEARRWGWGLEAAWKDADGRFAVLGLRAL